MNIWGILEDCRCLSFQMDEGIDFNPDKELCGGRVVSEEQRYIKHHSLAKFEFISQNLWGFLPS